MDDLVIAAYGSGHIRVFNSKTATILCEVCAHSRWINAIDLSQTKGLVSEFSFVAYLISDHSTAFVWLCA